MPLRPNTPCRHPGCAALVPYGTKYCDAHKPMHPEEVRSAESRGYGRAWQKARKQYLEAHPLCVECMKEGRYVRATDVDHIKPHRGDRSLFWDRSKPGDLWLIGKHRVICGDSTGEEVYTRLMDGQKANLVLTDPPYGVDVEETAGKIQNDNLPDAEFYDFLLSAFRCMQANLADDGSIYVWHADTKGLIFRKAYEDAGFYLSGCCIWKKNALVLGRSPYQWIHEPCLFGWKKGGKHQWYADRKQVTVWEYDKPKSSPDHPTTSGRRKNRHEVHKDSPETGSAQKEGSGILPHLYRPGQSGRQL